MNRFLEILLCTVFFAVVALPALYFFGLRDDWVRLAGVETRASVPALTLANFTGRLFQTAASEEFSKNFFLRRTSLKTALQLRDWLNFGQFHYGYHNSLIEGKNGVLFESPYTKYHLESAPELEKAKYAKAMSTVRDMDAFCKSVGADFVYLLIPDKSQVYPEYLPAWVHALWNYREHDVQSQMAALCSENGIKAFDARRFLLKLKETGDKWVFPPAGTHINAFGNVMLVEALVQYLNEQGRSSLLVNPLVRVTPSDCEWSVDDDIGKLLNIWDTHHVDANVRYSPVYAQTNVTLNAGSAIVLGDCFREQIAKVLGDSGVFAKGKVVCSRRNGQKPKDFKNVIGDLKLVIMAYQSFNTGRLDERQEEMATILSAMRGARATSR